jgi:hypothetical protein
MRHNRTKISKLCDDYCGIQFDISWPASVINCYRVIENVLSHGWGALQIYDII